LESVGLAAHVPEVQGFVRNNDVQAIKMEKVEGFSLAQLLENPDRYSLPENFDIDGFFNALEAVVTKMNEAGYFHRDLDGNAGNVMVTTEGEPVLVDFGTTVRATDYDPEESTYQIVPNGQRYRKNDIAGVKNLRLRLEEHLNKAA
jgi:serine/threonine protein kinase